MMTLRTVVLIAGLMPGLLGGPTVKAGEPGKEKAARIGYLFTGASARDANLLTAFRQGLEELGYVEGKNILIEERYGKRRERPALAAELVRSKVDIIVTGGGGATAAKRATSTIPIVMAYYADPVETGLITSLARPGGNVTGLSDYHSDLVTKRLELLKEIAPSAARIGVLLKPNHRLNQRMLQDLVAAAPTLSMTVRPLEAKGSGDVERAFATMRKERLGGFLQFFGLEDYRRRIVELAAETRSPAIYPNGGWIKDGGLMSYGSHWPDLFHRAATYVDKILRGAKPAELPVEQPTKFELLVNLKTAKRLGLTIPPSILYRADEVIR